ncbi:HNH endonuclease signature motif containing protein [Tsuneonella sp. HG222]
MWANNGKHQIKQLAVWWTTQKGYIEGRVLTAQGERRVKQHRFIIELHLGRLLREDEDVHHLNGNKSDNRIENLQVLTHSEHSQITNNERWSRAAISKARGAPTPSISSQENNDGE